MRDIQTGAEGNMRHRMKLELVQTVFRHGERTNDEPEVSIFNHFGPSAYEPFGIGQLTNNGKREAFKIGQMLRRRYRDFLGDKYNSKDVFAISTEDDRTKMSLQLVLAGLYPPTPEFAWNPDLKWSPIPIRYTPKEVDILFKPFFNVRYYDLWEKVFTSKEFQKRMSRYSDFFDFMKKKTGVDVSNDVVNKCYMFNSLYIPKQLNLPMPGWYTEDVQKTWCKVYAQIVSSMAATPQLQKMNGGPIVKTLLENMNIDNTTINPRKIYLYSGHDHNLFSLKVIFGLNEPDFFDVGSGLVLEKWRDVDDRLYVRILLWTVPGEEPRAVRLGQRDEFCPVEEFAMIFRHVIPTEEDMSQMFNDMTADRWMNIFLLDPAVQLK
ncbi:venom acid phosphatase Acph-1 isoform X2 [Nasonia vitripennis]|uniref:acid phosphatase n=1 Tax=Nasonia vitripennis TaxID=7425 RepID=A0A7M7Q8F0_NASVI|nr:venom acid phosphatase Acph-1 isoform X2 [Nasonia vitripennis]